METSSMKQWVTAACGILVLLFMSQSVLAQEQSPPRNWSIDMLGGVPYTQFTVGSEFLTPTAAFNIRYAANPRFAIRGSFSGGTFKGTGDNWFGQNYENQFLRFSLQPEFTVIRNDNVNLSLYGGVGVLKNYVMVSLDNPRGTGNRYAGEENDGITSNLSLGSEFRIRLSPRLDFLLQAEQNFTTSALMDGYDFEIGRNGNMVDQSQNDRFLTAMAGFTIKFGSSDSRHAMWDRETSVEEEVRPLARKIESLERKTEETRKQVEKQEEKVEQTQKKVDKNADDIEQLNQRNVVERVDSVQARVNELSKDVEKKEKMTRSTGNYYIIGGSFVTMDRAMRYLRELKSQGYDRARILPPKGNQERGPYRVAFTNGMSYGKANSLLESKYKSINSDAWLFEYHQEPVLKEQ